MTQRNLNNTNYGQRVAKIGYDLVGNVKDTLGRQWKYAAWPQCSGGIAFFQSLVELYHWCLQVEDMRRIQDEQQTLSELLAVARGQS